MKWPKVLFAQPTLRGLAIENPQPDGTPAEPIVYPWEHVSPFAYGGDASSWKAHGKDGSPLSTEERPLLLKIGGGRATRLAGCAQIRRFRQAWHDGTLAFCARYGRRSDLSLVVLTVVGLVVAFLVARKLPGLWDELTSVPLSAAFVYPAAIILVLAALGVAAFLTAIVRMNAVRLTTPRVVEATFDGVGVQARLRDGRVSTGRWADVVDVGVRGAFCQLRFRDGTTIPVSGEARTRSLVAVLHQQLHPEWRAEHQKAVRRSYVRCGLYGVFAAIIAGLILRVSPPPNLDPNVWLLAPAVLALSAPGMIGLALVGARIDHALDRRRRRRKRQRARERVATETRRY